MGHKSVSPAVAMSVVLIIMIVIIAVGWEIFLRPERARARAEKARTAEAPPASEVKPQPGMVVDWEPEQSLPGFIKVEIVLDKKVREGHPDRWIGHGVFSYRGETAEVGFDPVKLDRNQDIYTTSVNWKVWRTGEDEADAGIFWFPSQGTYKTPVGQKVFIEKITWIETPVRLGE